MILMAGAARPALAEFDPDKAIRTTTALVAELDQQRGKLELAAQEATEPLEKARADLALANWWLSFPAAAQATRLVLDMADDADRSAVADAARRAGTHLERARTILETESKPASDEAKKSRRELLAAARVLEAFAQVLDKAQTSSESEVDQETWRKSARGLAVPRESDDQDLAAAALLWQAFALEQADNRDRALHALPDAMAKPENLPFGLMSRLLRCRLIADAGQSPAAVALLSRMEGQLKDWIPSAQERNNARRLIGLVQYRIVTAWMEQLKSSTQPGSDDGAQTLKPILTEIEHGFTQVKEPYVYHMATAVPVIIAIEPKQVSATSTSTTPGD